MASITFKGFEEYAKKLEQLQNVLAEKTIQEKAVAAGAAIVADKIRENLEALPTDRYRHLRPGEVFEGIPEEQKQDLRESFGLSPISTDKKGCMNTHAGFDGYGSAPTRAYPKGLPNQMVAAATENGSSVRRKHPFIRTAVRATRNAAIEKMDKTLEEGIKKIIKE